MDELRKLLKVETIVFIVTFIASTAIWYTQTNNLNQLQESKLAQHDARISNLEQKQNTNDTQMAVIKVQLDSIQSDLKDIKAELKKK